MNLLSDGVQILGGVSLIGFMMILTDTTSKPPLWLCILFLAGMVLAIFGGLVQMGQEMADSTAEYNQWQKHHKRCNQFTIGETVLITKDGWNSKLEATVLEIGNQRIRIQQEGHLPEWIDPFMAIPNLPKTK